MWKLFRISLILRHVLEMVVFQGKKDACQRPIDVAFSAVKV